MREPGLETVSGAARAADSGSERIARELGRLAQVYADERVLAIAVRTSRRLTASLGRAHLRRGEIVLAEPLLESRHLEEVVVHEVAHIVCFWRHGRVRPHGAAWKAIMQQAGHVPRVWMEPRDIRLPPRRRRRRRRRLAAATLPGFLRRLL